MTTTTATGSLPLQSTASPSTPKSPPAGVNPPQTPTHTTNTSGSQRLFRSISRFLSGGNKSRSKLPQLHSPPTQRHGRISTRLNQHANNTRGGGAGTKENDQDDNLQLREVRSTSVSTERSRGRALSESTTSSASFRRLDNTNLLAPPGTGRRRSDGFAALRRAGVNGNGNQYSDDEEDDGGSGFSLGADTDASVRPISPNSLAPSRDSAISHAHTASTSTNASSLANTHRTHISYASTKPTTLLSIDSGGGANRIAVVPNQAPNGATGMVSSASGNSLSSPAPGITFSSLPSAPSSPSSPNSASQATSSPGIQVPHHSYPHPRNNPNPLSPPPDNASMLTLASSSFAPSIFPRSSIGGPQSLLRARYGVEADEDASVRALAGSRRASEESLGSRSTWSAAVLKEKEASLRTVGTGGTGAGGVESPLLPPPVGETEAQKVARKEGGHGTWNSEIQAQAGGDEGTPTEEHELEDLVISPSQQTATPQRQSEIDQFSPTNGHTAVDHHEEEEGTDVEDVVTPKKVKGKEREREISDAASSVFSAGGTDVDGQSFCDARSVVTVDSEA